MSTLKPTEIEQEDHELRIQKLKEEIEEVTGVTPVSNISMDCPPEVEVQFWEHVLAYEQARPTTLFEELKKAGLSLRPPDEIDEMEIRVRLWEVIHTLALMNTYLENTNHLSDRDLYSELWNHALREEVVLLPDDPSCVWHVDLIGSGSDEDTQLYLKYFADEGSRRRWKMQFPEDEMPAREKPPFDRDRDLPRPPV